LHASATRTPAKLVRFRARTVPLVKRSCTSSRRAYGCTSNAPTVAHRVAGCAPRLVSMPIRVLRVLRVRRRSRSTRQR